MSETHRMCTCLLFSLAVAACWLGSFTAGSAVAAPGKPSIETTTPYSIGATTVTLKAQIDPDGADTSYRFEYGSTAGYGSVVPLGGAGIGAGEAVVNTVYTLNGLESNTVYHYRVVATNSVGTTSSEDETFSTFGIAVFNVSVTEFDGSPDVYAGSHPYELHSEIGFSEEGSGGEVKPAGDAKDMKLELPTGLTGEPQAVPQCPQYLLKREDGVCPADSQIGTISVDLEGLGNRTVPLYNLVPVKGVPAQFGAFVVVIPMTLTAVIKPDDGYALSIDMSELTDLLAIKKVGVNLWGVPGDPRHDGERGTCLVEGQGSCPSGAGTKPFLTLPTMCGSLPTFTLKVDSWGQPGVFANATSGGAQGLMGCEHLDFTPTLEVQSGTTAADSPAGLVVTVGVPQKDETTGVAEASLKGMVVKLPEGTSINVGAADGLSGCSSGHIELHASTTPSCPDASKIGTAEISTPLLPIPLSGSIYLAQPNQNPFDSQFAAYVGAEADGVEVKLAMQITPDPVTGQLTVGFDEAPQLEFSGLRLSFNGGPRAMLATPSGCGTYTTTGQPTSYSEQLPGSQPILTSDFVIDSNCDGGFAPTFVAGSTSTAAGESTDFTMQVARPDGQQFLQSISATLPAGLLAKLGSVPLCGDAQAAAGTCGLTSRVGSATIGAGAGSHPFYFSGNAFLTGPYDGAPFGLSIVVPALAGPFDLGTVVIRARLLLNPRDARLTLATDALPTIRQGIPLRIRSVDVTVDRPGFISNPTNCATQRVNASIASAQATAQVSSPFTLTGCARLPFSPSVSASTGGRVSLKDGAALAVTIKEPQGTHANIKALRITLPRQLSSRLTTIRRACLGTTFNQDPAACPKGARIGSAQAHTTLLNGSLNGPVYLVSNGRAGPPEFVVILQGRGVILEMLGSLEVSSKDVMVVTFKSVPDASISSLNIKLPAGPGSVLGANGLEKASASQCGQKLVLHSTITGENGIRVTRATRLSVSGCTPHHMRGHKAGS